MHRILPFHGLRYNTKKAGPISELVAPPYDVVSDSERDEFVARNRHNIFTIELPKTNDLTDPFLHAKRELEKWINTGIITNDDNACIYPYYITYEVWGKKMVRRGFISLLRLENWSTGIVKPHEKTFDKVTENRLSLLRETRANLSPIFMLYKGDERVSEFIYENRGEEIYSINDRYGNTHNFYKIDDEDVIKYIQKSLENACFYIADGHHRYTTALKYMENTGDVKTGYIMTYLVDSRDDGLLILPTHRVLKVNSDFPPIPADLKDIVQINEIVLSDVNPNYITNLIKNNISPNGYKCLSIYQAREKKIGFLSIDLKKIQNIGIETHESPLFNLDVYWLDELIFKKIFKKSVQELKDSGCLSFVSGDASIFDQVRDDEILFYINPATVDDVIDISDKGLLMPQKSTFFYPKILTGFVLNSFDHSVRI